jgi:hypothetical protein
MTSSFSAYIILVDNQFDGIEHSMKSAINQMLDLQDMSCGRITAIVVTAKLPTPQALVHEAADEIESLFTAGKPFGRKGMKRIEEAYPGIKVTLAGPRSLTRLALEMLPDDAPYGWTEA